MSRLASILRELRRSERGIALPMAMLVTVVGLGLAAVPVVASISSQSGSSHNQAGNEALAAAEAGAELAVLRQGELHEQAKACPASAVRDGNGWCPESSATQGSIGAATYSYRVLPCYGTGSGSSCDAVAAAAQCATKDPMEVVSTGVAFTGGSEVTKRVSISACASAATAATGASPVVVELDKKLKKLEEELKVLTTPGEEITKVIVTAEGERKLLEETIIREKAEGKTAYEEKTGTKTEVVEREVPPPNVFAGGQIVGIDSLVMNNNAQVYNGGAGTNGPVSMEGSANVCGTVRYGTTKVARNGSENAPSGCAAGRTFVKSEPVTYPPITLPANIASSNSDARLAAADPVGANVWQRGNISWNESKKELSVNYDQITLEGTLPYYFCKLTLAGGSKLLAGAGKSIRIYFEDPANCPGLNGAPQLQIANGAYVGADSNHGPAFFFVGSTANPTTSKIELGGGANVSQFVVYAPRSSIVANNGVNVSGSIIGKSLELGGGAQINRAGTFTPPPVTEFLPSEKVKEEKVVSYPLPPVLTELGKHEEEVKKLEETILKKHEEEQKINKAPITQKTHEIEEVLAEIKTKTEDWEKNGGTPGGTFDKSRFVECSAARPGSTEPPSAGC